MRLFTRTVRRAALPVAMSQGFNPRPRISVPAPLSVGIAGNNEVLDLELSDWCRPEEVSKVMNERLPKGLSVISASVLSGKPDRRPETLSYSVPLTPGCRVDESDLRMLEKAESVVVERKTDREVKRKEIASFIGHLRLEGDLLLMLVKVTEQGTARPEEVLEGLGCNAYVHYFPSRITRTHVSLSSSP